MPSPEKTETNRLKALETSLETKAVAPRTLSETTTTISTTGIITSPLITTIIKSVIEPKESQKFFIHPLGHVEKQAIPQGNAILVPMEPIGRLPGTKDRKDRISSNKETTKNSSKGSAQAEAIQVHQAGKHHIPQYDSRNSSRSDHLSERVT